MWWKLMKEMKKGLIKLIILDFQLSLEGNLLCFEVFRYESCQLIGYRLVKLIVHHEESCSLNCSVGFLYFTKCRRSFKITWPWAKQDAHQTAGIISLVNWFILKHWDIFQKNCTLSLQGAVLKLKVHTKYVIFNFLNWHNQVKTLCQLAFRH